MGSAFVWLPHGTQNKAAIVEARKDHKKHPNLLKEIQGCWTRFVELVNSGSIPMKLRGGTQLKVQELLADLRSNIVKVTASEGVRAKARQLLNYAWHFVILVKAKVIMIMIPDVVAIHMSETKFPRTRPTPRAMHTETRLLCSPRNIHLNE